MTDRWHCNRNPPLNSIDVLPSLIGLVRLVRLSNSLPATALVILGVDLIGADVLDARVWWVAAAMWLITAWGYLTNDLFDIVEDRVNKPERPLPSGTVSIELATIAGIVLAVGTMSITIALGWLPFLAAITVLLLLRFYNTRLKATAGNGNLLIATLAGLALFPGAIVISGWHLTAITPLILPALILSCFVAARELLKEVEDQRGDRIAGKQTSAVVWGAETTLRYVSFLAGITIGLTLLPIWLLNYSNGYLLCILVGVDLPLLIVIGYCQTRQEAIITETQTVRQLLAILKGCYAAGLLGLAIA